MIKTCIICNKQFKGRADRKSNVYCSRNCRYKGQIKRKMDAICYWCGNTFEQRNTTSKTCSEDCANNCRYKNEARNAKISFSRLNSKNPMWKGNNVSLKPLHDWVKRRLVKPSYCTDCGNTTKKLDLANISQKYKRNLTDWEWLCRKCHMTKDGRIKNLKNQNPINQKSLL